MFILVGTTYHTFDSVVECAEEILLKGTGLTKRKSLVVVFRTNKVFFATERCYYFFEKKSLTERVEEVLLKRPGLTKRTLCSCDRLTDQLSPSIAFESTTFPKFLFVAYLIRYGPRGRNLVKRG